MARASAQATLQLAAQSQQWLHSERTTPIIWWFPKIGVPTKSSILVGFSIINQSAIGVPQFMEIPIFTALFGVISQLSYLGGPTLNTLNIPIIWWESAWEAVPDVSSVPLEKPTGSGFVKRAGWGRVWNSVWTEKSSGWWFGTSILFSHINWECHHPNWLSYFSEGWKKPPTRACFLGHFIVYWWLVSLTVDEWAMKHKKQPPGSATYCTRSICFVIIPETEYRSSS